MGSNRDMDKLLNSHGIELDSLYRQYFRKGKMDRTIEYYHEALKTVEELQKDGYYKEYVSSYLNIHDLAIRVRVQVLGFIGRLIAGIPLTERCGFLWEISINLMNQYIREVFMWEHRFKTVKLCWRK